VFKVRLKCKRGTLPPHVLQCDDDGSYLVCIGGCDQGIIDALDFRLRKTADSNVTSGKC
jgi:hypothetical protein